MMQTLRSQQQRSALLILLGIGAVCTLAYQNCSSGFVPLNGLADSSTSLGSAPGIPSSIPAMPTTPSTTYTNSFLFVGAPDKIATFKIDRATDQVTRLADVSVSGRTPGWFAYDATKNRMFVSDGYGPSMTTLTFAPLTGLISIEAVFSIISNVIHFSLYPGTSAYQLYTASFDDSMSASYDVNSDIPTATQLGQTTFPSGTETHSVTADRNLNLVFLSNMGESLIRIYNDSTGLWQPVSTVSVANPRIVMYDSIFDRVYLTTQVATGNSEVAIYNVVQTNGVYSLAFVSSMPMGLNGSDLKIDHVNGYVSASVRDPGKEGVWMFPVDKTGLFDPSRANVFLPVTQTEARSLQVSADGRYYAIACNNAVNTVADTVIYELVYAADSSVSSSKIISQQLVGPANVLANYWIDTN